MLVCCPLVAQRRTTTETTCSMDLQDATVDITTDGVEETTVVTATALGLEEGLELAGNTTVCFWVGVVRMVVEPSLDTAALLCV